MGLIMRDSVPYAGSNDIVLTQAQYDALVQTGEVLPNVNYYISNANHSTPIYASGVHYDNSDSGLSATNVQGAIDELDALALGGCKIIKKTNLSATFSNSNISASVGNAKTIFDLGASDTIVSVIAFGNGQPLIPFTNSQGNLYLGGTSSLNSTYGFTAVCIYTSA